MYLQILTLSLLLAVMLLGGWYWQSVVVPDEVSKIDSATVYLEEVPATEELVPATTSDPYAVYEPLYPMQIGEQVVQASLAITPEERRRGLSNTLSLPADVAKVFIFPEAKEWGFWMKDMNYPIDIIWVDEDRRVVHVASDVSPASYPESFKPPQPARYVIETVAGFAAEHSITPGTLVSLPEEL